MFKKVLTAALIFIYLFGINLTLVYYAEYKINFSYIVKYICEQKDEEENLCLGNCYLKKNLAKAEHSEKQTESRSLELPSVTVAPHNFYSFKCSLFLTYKEIKYPGFIKPLLSQTFITPNTLPPELFLV